MPINAVDLATAGLPTEGVYRFKVEDGEKRIGKTSGNPYMNLHFTLIETPDGAIERPPHEWDNFFSKGTALQRLNSLCMAVLGYIPEGERDPETGEFNLDEEDLADALVDGTCWGTYSYNREDDGRITGRIGWRFATDPAKLRAPRPLIERELEA